jgi:hypothetical protein
MVGTGRLELPSSGPQAGAHSKLRHVPMRTPERNRTSSLLVRSQVLCPLSYRGLVPPRGVEPLASALSERRPYHTGHDGLAEGAGFEPAPDCAGLP